MSNSTDVENVKKPIAAVIAIVIDQGKVLLIRRANPPDVGRWGFPGGKIELGEPLLQAAERELFEETGMVGNAVQVLTATDAFDADADGRVRQHFVLVAVLCRSIGGQLQAADDALEAEWHSVSRLGELEHALSLDVRAVAEQALHFEQVAVGAS